MTDQLKACPFCGQDDWRVGTHHQDDVVVCGNCTAEAPLQYWNERPLEDALRAEVNELSDELVFDRLEHLQVKIELDTLRTNLREAVKEIENCPTNLGEEGIVARYYILEILRKHGLIKED